MSVAWRALKAGDKVRIIAPGAQTLSPTDDLQKCCDYLQSLQLIPEYTDSIFAPSQSFYAFANTDAARYADFVAALQSDAAAIWCFRGGYGSDRVIAQIIANHITPKQGTKLFIGFSDVTNLHSYLNKTWGWQTLHASVLKQFGRKEISAHDADLTQQILFGAIDQVQLSLVPLNRLAKQTAEITAQITGGNLTTLQCAIGTAWEAPINHNILLLEDVGEAPYRIARMFQQLLASRYLEKTQAIILGDFISDQPAMALALKEFAAQSPVPVLRYKGIGHGEKNHPIPFGTSANLTLGKQPTLHVATGVSSHSQGLCKIIS